MIKQESIEILKSRLDVVDVIGSYIELKKSGAGTYKACCPFHTEKTASFTVSASKQIYHCFGCKASGDAIKFVQEYERLSYPETLEKLAGSYGVKLEYTESQKSLTTVFKKMNDFFLSEFAANETAKAYLQKRGVSLSSFEGFEIGYAPTSRTQIEFARKNMLSIAELVEAGIFGEEGGNIFARFVERVIFPIKNQNGVIIGFGGRTLTNHPAKYVNSPQTKYFNKSKTFYALEKARDEAIKRSKLIIVEGYMDALMLHQYGFANAVAVLGTALTKELIPTIKKLRCEVILAFDSDKAGLSAAVKSSLVLMEHGISGGVAMFDKGEDPADMLVGGKQEAVEDVFDKPIAFGKFLIDQIALRYDLSNPMQKQSAYDETVALLKQFSPVLQDEYKQYACVVLKIDQSLFKSIRAKREYTITIGGTFDLAEASLIKTIIEKPNFADILLDRVSKVLFAKHQDLLEAALLGKDEPKLNELLMDESIKVLDEEHFVSDLKKLTARYLESAKNIIRSKSDLSSEQKSFWLRRINELQLDFRAGKFVTIDEELEKLL